MSHPSARATVNEHLKALASSMYLALIAAGIGGLFWSAFREGGWGGRLVDLVLEEGALHPWLLLPGIGGAIFLAAMVWRGGLRPGRGTFLDSLLINGMALSGLYFIYRWCLAP